MKSLAQFIVAIYVLLAIGSSSAVAQTIPTSYSWTSTGPLISAKSNATHSMIAVKDPSVVYYNGQYIVYASDVNSTGNYNMEYLHFTNWSEASAATPYFLDDNPNLAGYHTAPQVFYFTPQKKWYLIFQSGQAQYSTNSDPTQPQNWTTPTNFFASQPLGLDYWVICDSANCYLFFCDDGGQFYSSSTPIGDFPNGFSTPTIVYSEPNEDNLFEADNVYAIAGTGKYLANIECIGGPDGHRFFRSLIANSLAGPWTPLGNTLNFSTPFLGEDNVTFQSGVSAWTDNFSSGGMIPSYDQTATVNLNNFQFLYQGSPPSYTGSYNLTPWQLGLATSNANGFLIPDGTYTITSVHSGLAVDDPGSSTTDGKDMQIYTVNDGANQQWAVTNLGGNVITLTNVASGQQLDVSGDSKSGGALVDQWPTNGQTNQQWNVISLGGGSFELTSVNSGLALDVVGGGTTNGTEIDQWQYGGATWQQWKFTSH